VGRDWGVFFLRFRRPRALSEIEAKIGTQIAWGGGQRGRVNPPSIFTVGRSIFTATLFNIALPSFGGGTPHVRVGGKESQETWI
jgi:hypothetical protein